MNRPLAKIFALTLAVCATAAIATAQNKVLTHADYDGWKSIGAIRFSNDGKWIVYSVSPQEGDGLVEIKSTDGSKSYTLERGSNVNFSEDSKFAVATIVPKRDDVKKATADKVKPEDRPKNDLVILNLASGQKTELNRITSYSIPPKDSGWIIYRPEPPKPAAPAKPADKPAEKPAEEGKPKTDDPKKKKGHGDGSTIVLRNLATGEDVTMENVGTYITDEHGTKLYYNYTPSTTEGHGVFVYDFKSKSKRPILEGLGQYTRLNLSEDEDKIAILTDKDDYEAETSSQAIYLANTSGGTAKRVAYEGDPGIPEGWYIPSNSSMRWSKSGERLFFSTVVKPKKDEKKDETPDDEKVEVDIWNWQDIELQPQQLLRANFERNRTYEAILNVPSGRILQIETPERNSVALPREGNGNWGLYVKALDSGAGATPDDVFIVDLRNGEAKPLLMTFTGNLGFSPTGRWLIGFDAVTKKSFFINPDNLQRTDIDDRFPHPIYDTEDDHPFGGDPYGTAGWNSNDSIVYVYDKFDIYALDLTKSNKAVSVTNGYGRISNTVFRYESVDPEEEFIDPSKPAYLTAFNPTTKADGYAITTFNKSQSPQILVKEDAAFSGLSRARDAEVYRYQRERINEYRDVYVTNAKLENGKRLSDVNPQTSEYVWPTVELVKWRSLDGVELQGLLYKPSDFSLRNQYPMVAYFYERSSDGMHRYQTPAPSASTINIAYFVSNGYCVFVPDIPYKIGYPGESAVSAIVPGVNSILERGFVDPKRVGIQGQSWGGYQVAYLVTETDMFACAEAGAPVSNMFSAYGGIRYGSGSARQLQYEQGQSRIGGTMWENPMRYWENSPIFFADKVKTPLMIMANDKDGAVPDRKSVV